MQLLISVGLSPSLPHSQGLRVQDIKEISPWEIIEGIRNSGPLQPSWFGAVRMKRRPLRYLEQRKLVHFHTHQNTNEAISTSPYNVSLPEPSSADNYTPNGDRIPATTPPDPPMVVVTSIGGGDVKPTPVPSTRVNHPFEFVGGNQPPVAPPTSMVSASSSLPDRQRQTLEEIKKDQIRRMQESGGDAGPFNPVPPSMIQSQTMAPQPQPQRGGEEGMAPAIPGSHQINQVPNPGIATHNPAAVSQAAINHASSVNRHIQVIMNAMTPEQRNHLLTLPIEQRKHHLMQMRNRMIHNQQRLMELHRIQQQQQQQQRVNMMSGGGHLGGFRQPMAHGPQHVGPMQANPPMPMQQVMQQQQQRQMAAPGFLPGMGQMGHPQPQQQLYMRSHQQVYVRPHGPGPMYPGIQPGMQPGMQPGIQPGMQPGMQPRHPGYYN